MSAPSSRAEGFDGLRALAMLLGIGYHATFAYVPDIGPWYLVQDIATDAIFKTIGSVLHAGRMQVFFALSGFFAHLVFERRGAQAFISDRLRRLGLPLLVAAPLLVLFDVGAQRWGLAHGVVDAHYRGLTDSPVRPLHLWFLEYLLVFSAVAVLFKGRSVRLSPPAWLVLGTGLTWATALSLGEATPAFSFVPQAASILHFGPFFAFGWCCWANKAALPSMRAWRWALPIGVALACWVYSQPLQWRPEGEGLGSLSTWLTVVGAVALAAHIQDRRRAWLRWLVDASYWVYLVHYPLVVSGHLLLARAELSAWVKYLAVVSVTSLLTLGSYALLVRPTAIGRWLNPSTRRVTAS